MSDLTSEQRADWEQVMRSIMSEISESTYAASWMYDLCPCLYKASEIALRTGKTVCIRLFCVSPALAETLYYIADKLGYWTDYDKPYDPSDYLEEMGNVDAI